MRCPECGRDAGRSKRCPCGWEASRPRPREEGEVVVISDGTKHYVGVLRDETLGYIRCSWFAGGERCRFPGTMSTNVKGGGPWFCSAHHRCSDPIAGADVVEASRGYHHPGVHEADIAHGERAAARCRALGLRTVAEKRAWLRENVRRFVAAAVAREPGADDEERSCRGS